MSLGHLSGISVAKSSLLYIVNDCNGLSARMMILSLHLNVRFLRRCFRSWGNMSKPQTSSQKRSFGYTFISTWKTSFSRLLCPWKFIW